jgi:triphosphatase
LSAWYLHEPGARLGDDAEELHDLRVAGRRMDAILRQFQTSLPKSLLGIRPTLKKVLRALGETRDLDVALSELDTFSRKLQESDREGVEPLKLHLVSARGRARDRMLTLLDSASVQKNFQKLASLLSVPAPARQPSSPEMAVNLAPDMIRRRYRKVRKGADVLTPESSTEAFHAVRSDVKKLRYALEAVAVIYAKPADEMLRALRRWQEKLGVQQDAAVASRRLKAFALAPPRGTKPETLFVMGRLAEYYASGRARKVYSKAYREVRRRWKRLRVKLQRPAADNAPTLSDNGR